MRHPAGEASAAALSRRQQARQAATDAAAVADRRDKAPAQRERELAEWFARQGTSACEGATVPAAGAGVDPRFAQLSAAGRQDDAARELCVWRAAQTARAARSYLARAARVSEKAFGDALDTVAKGALAVAFDQVAALAGADGKPLDRETRRRVGEAARNAATAAKEAATAAEARLADIERVPVPRMPDDAQVLNVNACR